MIAFVIRRLLQGVMVMLVVGFIAFSLFNFIGDPVSLMLPPEATQADRDAMRASLGLDKPFYVQFATFLANSVQGNFGISLRLGRPVSTLLVERLPATLELALTAALIGLFVGIPSGVYTALHRDSWISRAMLTTSLVGVSLPNFLIGIFLILIFAVWLGLLPSFGRGDTVMIGAWSTGLLTKSGLKALVLPAITLGFFPVTVIMRLVRAEMLEVLRADYIKFARARGISEHAVNFTYALKNTLIPVITITGLQLGGIIAFAIVTET
ncbi:MAG: ABC transporter permease, partial [Usitatibacter sp.]